MAFESWPELRNGMFFPAPHICTDPAEHWGATFGHCSGDIGGISPCNGVGSEDAGGVLARGPLLVVFAGPIPFSSQPCP